MVGQRSLHFSYRRSSPGRRAAAALAVGRRRHAAEQCRPLCRSSARSQIIPRAYTGSWCGCGTRNPRSGGELRSRRISASPGCTPSSRSRSVGMTGHLHVFETRYGRFGMADAESGIRAEAPVTLEQVAPDANSRLSYLRLRRRLATRHCRGKGAPSRPCGRVPAVHWWTTGGATGGLRRRLGIRPACGEPQ